jgi:hypothetical protein
MADINLPHNWKPRPYQQGLWDYLELGGKRAYMVAHRRWGKDDVALHMTATKMMEKPGNYWHMLPESTSVRKAIWDAVNPHTGKKRIDEAFPKALRSKLNNSEMKIELINGSTWQALGSDNYNSYMGSAPLGVLFSEWALADPQAWPYIQPILEENGGWAVFITTPRGRNHAATFFEMAQASDDWYCERQGANKTGVFSQKQLDAIKNELVQLFGHAEGNARFQQEYHCSFDAALPGAYYGEQINAAEEEERITFVPWDPSHRVIVAFDFGRGQSNSAALVFCQVVGMEARIIDYHEDNTGDIPTHCELMRKKPYAYSHLVLPHDAAPVRYGTGLSYEDQFKAAGFKVKVMKVTPDLKRDINITRQFIKTVWINVRKCSRLIDCLRAYHRKWNSKDKTFEDHPHHDWSSHGADGVRAAAVAHKMGMLMEDTDIEEMDEGDDGGMGGGNDEGRNSLTGY